MDFGFDNCALHIFLMRTRLVLPQVPENLFLISFGGIKVQHGDLIFQKHLFLQGFLRKSSFIRSTTPIIPHEEVSGMIRIAHTQRTNTETRPRAGGTFSTSPPPRELWLTVHRGQQVTRREGTSKSNCLCAMGGFAPKVE